MPYCNSCETYYSKVLHKCPPPYLVWCEDHGQTQDDAQEILALSSDVAAEKWADKHDCESAEYDIVGQREEPIVCVSRDGEVEKFRVSGEAIASYSAYPQS